MFKKNVDGYLGFFVQVYLDPTFRKNRVRALPEAGSGYNQNIPEFGSETLD